VVLWLFFAIGWLYALQSARKLTFMFMMKMRFYTRFVSLALVGSVVFAPLAQAAFSDVTGGEFAQYINDLSARGVLGGAGGNFYPSFNLTRGELAKVLVNAAGIPVANGGTSRFSDVPAGHTFYDYIMTLAARGTVNGYSNGTFRPNAYVTRGEFSKMVMGAFGFQPNTQGGPHFAMDVPASHTFYSHVETLYNLNVLSGYSASTFGVNDNVTREQMAKIVSRAIMAKAGTLESRPGMSGALKEFPLTFNYAFPRLRVTPDPDSDRVDVSTQRFPELSEGSMYELWASDATTSYSLARFNVEDGVLVSDRHLPVTSSISLPVPLRTISRFSVTIEPTNDGNVNPSSIVVVRGLPSNGTEAFDLDFPIGYGNTNAVARIFGTGHNVLSVNFDNLPNLSSIGWQYQAWYVKDGSVNSAGFFSGNGVNTLFRSGTLPVDLFTAQQVKVSVEPMPDDSTMPSLVVWSGTVPGAPTAAGTTTATPSSDPAHDQALYEGLTTSMTTASLRARTVVKKDTAARVIVQAYAAAPVVAENQDQSIVVKVSDLNGNPISDLNLEFSRVDGPSANFTDPQEVGTNSGVYVGSYRNSEDISTTDTAVVRIQSDGSLSSNDDEVDVPAVDVEFTVSSSTVIGSPRALEIDVTRDETTFDENDSYSDQNDLIVLATVTDSNRKGVESVLSSGLTLQSQSSTATGYNDNNIKYFTLDDRFFGLDNEDNDITVNRTFSLQLIPGSSDDYAPITTDQYTLRAKFIARDDN
jgi:hypothetical protein